MERQGRSYIGFQIFPGSIFLGVVLAVLLLSVSGWAACAVYTARTPGGTCSEGNIPDDPWITNTFCTVDYLCVRNGWTYCTVTNCPYCSGSRIWGSVVHCNTKCESDSVQCVNAGKDWNSDACQCSDPCDKARTQCISMGGEFEGGAINKPGSPGTRCCNGVCNLCTTKASKEQWEKKKYYCCSQNKAPPAMNNCAINSPPVGCGISTKFKTNSDNGACRDPNLSEDASQSFYENCSGVGSSSSEGGNSSGAGSSGTDGSSSSGVGPYPEGCDECPWLDSILDTLTAQKRIVSDISDCLQNAEVCLNLNPDTGEETVDSVYIDSTILNGIKDLFDSSLELDDEQVRILMSMDTTLLKMLVSDSATRVAIAGASSDIVSAVSGASGAVQGGLVQVKNGIVSMDTAMKRRLDSLIKTIPSDILDSIVIYQDSALDRFDSVLFGKGVGFSLVDSLTDSIVKYFKVSNHYDSAYSVMFAEYDTTLKSIRNKMDNMSFGLDASNLSFSVDMDFSPLGYGDTATVTLRDDLHSMNDAVTGAINHIDTTVIRELQNLVERQEGFYAGATGYGVSGSSTLKSDLADVKGILESTLGSIDGKLDGVAEDTNVDYGILREGSALRDTILDETGLGRISFGDDTTAYLQAESAPYDCVGDSCCVGSDCVYVGNDQQVRDSFMQVMSAYADTIRMKNEAVKQDSFTSYVSQLKDSVTSWNPLGAFDSTILSTLGSRMPNSNTCPEDCFVNDVTIPFAFGPIPLTINYGLCTPRAPLANGNVLSFLRFLIRLFVAIACVYTIMWNAAGRKGG